MIQITTVAILRSQFCLSTKSIDLKTNNSTISFPKHHFNKTISSLSYCCHCHFHPLYFLFSRPNFMHSPTHPLRYNNLHNAVTSIQNRIQNAGQHNRGTFLIQYVQYTNCYVTAGGGNEPLQVTEMLAIL